MPELRDEVKTWVFVFLDRVDDVVGLEGIAESREVILSEVLCSCDASDLSQLRVPSDICRLHRATA